MIKTDTGDAGGPDRCDDRQDVGGEAVGLYDLPAKSYARQLALKNVDVIIRVV